MQMLHEKIFQDMVARIGDIFIWRLSREDKTAKKQGDNRCIL